MEVKGVNRLKCAGLANKASQAAIFISFAFFSCHILESELSYSNRHSRWGWSDTSTILHNAQAILIALINDKTPCPVSVSSMTWLFRILLTSSLPFPTFLLHCYNHYYFHCRFQQLQRALIIYYLQGNDNLFPPFLLFILLLLPISSYGFYLQ